MILSSLREIKFLYSCVFQGTGKLGRRENRWIEDLARKQNHGVSSVDVLGHPA